MSEYRRRQAWQAGVKAAREGKHPNTCNRPRGTIFFDDWHDGYESIVPGHHSLYDQEAGL